MAIVKGKRLNNSDKLNALAKENDRAASEYAWIMPTVSDCWGRFKLSQRRVLADCYEWRQGVTELMVADWLVLFEKYKLLQTYTVEGVLYAEWTNWQGQADSQKTYHHTPEPPWSSHKHTGRCRLRGDSRTGEVSEDLPTPKRGKLADSPTLKRQNPVDSPTPKHQKLADSPTLNPEILADSPIHYEPTVPTVPPVTIVNQGPRANSLVGNRDERVMEVLRLCAEIGKRESEDPSEVMAKASEYKGQSKLNPASMSDDRLLHTLRKLRERNGKQQPTVDGREFIEGLETVESILRRKEQRAREERERGSN